MLADLPRNRSVIQLDSNFIQDPSCVVLANAGGDSEKLLLLPQNFFSPS